MLCANCDKPAMFEYRITQDKSIFYCGKDLPKFLEERRKAGLLTITDANQRAEKTALDALSSETPKKKLPKKSDQ